MSPVVFYVLGVVSILIVVSVICFRNKEGLTNAVNVELLGTLRIITPELGGSATSHPIALSRPVLANELADFTPVDTLGCPTSHGAASYDKTESGASEIKPASTSAPSSDSCPTGCSKPTTVAGNCAPITVNGVEKHVCPYVCTGDYDSGCKGLDEACRDCGNVTLPEITPAPVPSRPRTNKFLGMVVEFPSTSSKPSSYEPNVYMKDNPELAPTGGWGGVYTCPDGQDYVVGDHRNGCGEYDRNKWGHAPLAGVGGKITKACTKDYATHRNKSGWGVVCGKKKSTENEKYYITKDGVLRKAGAGCTQRPVVLDVPLSEFLSANKFTLGTPMSDKDTCGPSPANIPKRNECSVM